MRKKIFSDLSCTHGRTCVYGRYAPDIFDFAWLLTCTIFRKGDTFESQSEISLDLFVFNHKST